jgi:sulfate-transporting ATPase
VLALILTQSGLNIFWMSALITTCGSAIILLSFVIVTGYSGQLSLAQFGFAGLGAWTAGKLLESAHFSFPLAALCGIVAMLPLGLLLGVICLRTSGVNLAIATLGLALGIENLVFDSPSLTGAYGITIGSPHIFGLDIGAISHPSRYAAFSVLALFVAALVTANIRKGVTGRRLLAARANERAAASIGLQQTQAKVFAFGIASMVAAFGGVVIAFANSNLNFVNFSTLPSVSAVAQSVIGGVGWVFGSVIGGIGQVGGLLTQGLTQWVGVTLANYVPLAGAVLLIVVLILQPDGAAAIITNQLRPVMKLIGGSRTSRKRDLFVSGIVESRSDGAIERVEPKVLQVVGLSVAFGGVNAVRDVSLTVRPGEVVGLIGPNGAGKTTVIDAITGFVHAKSGEIMFNDRSLQGMRSSARARLGLTRSFQSLELFDDLSVFDNLAAASDPRGIRYYATDIVYPKNSQLSEAAQAAIPEFGLVDILDKFPTELSYGTRRLVAIARAVATGPSVLLLDEPAAGLDDRETAELSDLVVRLARQWGMGVLLVEHDVAMVMSVCDHVHAMELGTIIAEGTPFEVRNHEEVIRSFLGSTGGAVVGGGPADKGSSL